ncbi:MAG: hypothetical protein JSV74_03335 [Dehalococcoidia bacterium]|nr:MAG: hypothetical protein JSV74_03335 [Dehalococcoidia bacterium]
MPTFAGLEPPIPELSIDEVYSDYMKDSEAAEMKYSGKRFLFSGVVIDSVESYYLNSRASDISLMVDNIKFKPRFEYDLDPIFPGFVVDITGVPRSLLLDHILIVSDCLVFVVEGGDYTPSPIY